MKRLILMLSLLPGCEQSASAPYTDPPITEPRWLRALNGSGLTNAVSTGAPFFECSDSDSLMNSTGFRAKNAKGEPVEGVLCCGWVKGCTVRY